jgi:hypothetical protein
MKIENLLSAAQDRVKMKTWDPAMANIMIRENYGLDVSAKRSNLSTIDQIFDLVGKASERSFTFHRSKPRVLDVADEIVKKSFNAQSENIHPIDDAFLLLESAVKIFQNETVNRNLSGNSDPVNLLVKSYETRIIGKHSATDLYDLISSIYDVRCPNGKAIHSEDPVNDLVKNLLGNGRFPEQPKHTLTEWNKLIESAIGRDIEIDIMVRSEDSINDFMAKQTGKALPSAKALDIIMDKLYKASYELGYKLTPGTVAYQKKSEEIKLLQVARKKREDNLKEVNNPQGSTEMGTLNQSSAESNKPVSHSPENSRPVKSESQEIISNNQPLLESKEEVQAEPKKLSIKQRLVSAALELKKLFNAKEINFEEIKKKGEEIKKLKLKQPS